MWACALGHQRAAELLYGWNSSALGIPDSLGRLPLAVARSRGHTRLAAALEELHTHMTSQETHTPATPQPPQSPLSTSPDTGNSQLPHLIIRSYVSWSSLSDWLSLPGLSSSSSLPSPSDPSSPSPSSAYSSGPTPMDTSPSSPSSPSSSSFTSSLPVSPPSPSSVPLPCFPQVSVWAHEPDAALNSGKTGEAGW